MSAYPEVQRLDMLRKQTSLAWKSEDPIKVGRKATAAIMEIARKSRYTRGSAGSLSAGIMRRLCTAGSTYRPHFEAAE